nr:MAG TPA: hypothetical protein [Caudoviricetes sp.]
MCIASFILRKNSTCRQSSYFFGRYERKFD